MKNYKFSYLSIALLVSNTAIAVVADPQQESVTIEFILPQTISVSTPNTTTGSASGSVGQTTWEITSNNAISVNFMGDAPTETAESGRGYPQFSKQEVDADGTLIANRYDHLDTKYGLVIIGSDSIANETSRTNQTAIKTWRGGDIPDASPSQLVTDKTLDGSPGLYWGAIMPSDAGKFKMSLYSQGVGTADSTQSGVYSTTVTAVITANEQLNPQ